MNGEVVEWEVFAWRDIRELKTAFGHFRGIYNAKDQIRNSPCILTDKKELTDEQRRTFSEPVKEYQLDFC